MKTNGRYYIFFAALLTLLFSCSERKRMPSLEESFSKSDKNPFGTYVAFREINEFFYRNDVRIKRATIEKSLDDFNDTSSLFISISRHFYLRSTERNALLSYVSRGNDAFLSSRDFDSSFLKVVGVNINDSGSTVFPDVMNMENTGTSLSAPYFSDNVLYDYYYNPVLSSFTAPSGVDTVRVLGSNQKGQPNFIVVFHGKGRFYLHCEPRLFSNYFLLQDKNYKYLQQVFSLMPPVPDNVYWDDYYNKRNYQPRESANASGDDGDMSGWSVIFKYPPLTWAFWLLLLLILLYLLFGGKRRQRIINSIVQTENTSVAFTETVGRLYLQKKDNRNIADKMITYLLEHIRNQYFISTTSLTDDFTTMLSRKSSLPYEEVQRLMATINRVQRMDVVDDTTLLALNQQIENFYKNKS